MSKLGTTTLLLVVAISASDAQACGEVMYRMGGALRYHAFITRHPAQILLYSGSAAQQAASADSQRFHENLEKAGHKVTVVDGPDALAKAAPDIPAIAETLPGYVATSWYGVGAPAGTPEPVLAKLEAAITEALKQPDIQKRWADDLGLDMPPPGRAGFAQFLAEDRKLWAPVVKASGVKLD